MCCPSRVETGNTLSSPISERTKGRSMLIHRCQWVSTKPGMQIRPRPSITSAPDTLTSAPTAAMAPSRMWTAPLAKSPSLASMVSTLAPRITISPRAGSGSARPDWAARPVGRQPMAPNAAAPSSTVRRVKRWIVIGLLLPRNTLVTLTVVSVCPGRSAARLRGELQTRDRPILRPCGGPGSAVQHFVLHRVRDTQSELAVGGGTPRWWSDSEFALPRPAVQVVRGAAAGADLRVGVDELVVGQLVDRARLQRAFPVRERAGRELHREGLLVLVHGVGAELRNGAAHDAGIFLGCGREPVAGGDLRHLAGDVDLREVALRREDQNAARFRTERKRFLSVGRGHLGDDEMPGAKEAVLQRLLLRGGIAGRARKHQRSGGNLSKLHGLLPVASHWYTARASAAIGWMQASAHRPRGRSSQ